VSKKWLRRFFEKRDRAGCGPQSTFSAYTPPKQSEIILSLFYESEQVLFPSLKLGNKTFDASRFARRCKQRQPQNMSNIPSDLSVRK
jgi:hypothetical protein